MHSYMFDNDDRPPLVEPCKKRLMAQMHPVEIADRNGSYIVMRLDLIRR
jgi:hypothetical protein